MAIEKIFLNNDFRNLEKLFKKFRRNIKIKLKMFITIYLSQKIK